jgi:hypothetical protein
LSLSEASVLASDKLKAESGAVALSCCSDLEHLLIRIAQHFLALRQNGLFDVTSLGDPEEHVVAVCTKRFLRIQGSPCINASKIFVKWHPNRAICSCMFGQMLISFHLAAIALVLEERLFA